MNNEWRNEKRIRMKTMNRRHEVKERKYRK